MCVEEKKIIRSNKLFPLFSGLTTDLLFWAAINTLFLTNVNGFTSAQISSLVSFGLVSTILFQPLSYKIIKKIGNINNILDKDEMFKLCNINNKEESAPSEETLTEQKTENVKEEASSE